MEHYESNHYRRGGMSLPRVALAASGCHRETTLQTKRVPKHRFAPSARQHSSTQRDRLVCGGNDPHIMLIEHRSAVSSYGANSITVAGNSSSRDPAIDGGFAHGDLGSRPRRAHNHPTLYQNCALHGNVHAAADREHIWKQRRHGNTSFFFDTRSERNFMMQAEGSSNGFHNHGWNKARRRSS